MSKGIEISRVDNLCALCRQHEADEVGSHMAPNFIIHKAFAFDGAGKRDHEISNLFHLNQHDSSTYYGRSVSPEAIEADLGHEMTDKEIDENVNNLVYDHIFCKSCEKRFSLLETEYAKFYADGKDINPKVAYLFWLSVFWRMSIGSMGFLLNISDELEIRNILDKKIGELNEIISSENGFGNWGYIIWRCKDVRKGDSGILGLDTYKTPYLIILNDLVVALVRDNANKKHKIAFMNVSSQFVNSWTDDDIYIEDITLERFARIKRWMIDKNVEYGYGPQREKMLVSLQETHRANDIPEFSEEERMAIGYAYQLDLDDGMPSFTVRNLYKFWGAALKEAAVKRMGGTYDILKDRSLMIFPFDIENYKNDLISLAKIQQKSENERKSVKKRWNVVY